MAAKGRIPDGILGQSLPTHHEADFARKLMYAFAPRAPAPADALPAQPHFSHRA
jgi:hypothetical protein